MSRESLVARKKELSEMIEALTAERRQVTERIKTLDHQRQYRGVPVCTVKCCYNLTSRKTALGKLDQYYKLCDSCREKSRLYQKVK